MKGELMNWNPRLYGSTKSYGCFTHCTPTEPFPLPLPPEVTWVTVEIGEVGEAGVAGGL